MTVKEGNDEKKSLLVVSLIVVALCLANVAGAIEISDKLNKKFKSSIYPYEEQTVTIHLKSKLDYLKGNRKERDESRSIKILQKVVSVFKHNGWQKDDPLLLDSINGGLVEIVTGEGMSLKAKKTNRLKIFINMCDRPMRKYRGGDLNEYLNKMVKDAEYCITYDHRLQGRNYPY